MRGYGRDYDQGRNWVERAGDTVRGWFGGGRDYDRDFGWDGGSARGMHRDWDRGLSRGGYRMNNWNNQHATRDAVERAGGYYGMDYERGYDRGMHGSGWTRGDYGRDYATGGWARGGLTRGVRTGRGRMGMQQGSSGGMRDTWLGHEYGGGGYNAGNDWGDYNRGGYGGQAFRDSRSGGVEPGRYFDGYGIGSSGGHGYEPY